MSNLDLFIVNVALPSIGADFGGSLARLSWILNGYAIAFAALLIAAGRLGDRIGQRRVFLAGVTVFTLASALCAAAPNLGVLVAARVLQAGGAAALIPTSLALLLAATPVQKRSGAVRGWAAIGGISAALGPVAGGLLVQANWRWVFLVNLPVGIAAIIAGRIVLPHPAGRPDEPLPDLLGAALLTAGIGALTGALVEAPGWGWGSARAIALFAAAVIALGWFLARCFTHERPLIELALFRIPSYGTATAAVFLFSLGFAAMLLSNVLWCQDVWHYSALRTGLSIAPGPAMVPALALGAGPLVRRLGPGIVAAAGNVTFAAGLLWRVLLAGTTPHYVSGPAAEHAADRYRGRPGPPDAHQHHRDRAARRPVRHRFGDRQHQPAGRVSPRGRDPGDDPRHACLAGSGARRVPARLDLCGRREPRRRGCLPAATAWSSGSRRSSTGCGGAIRARG